MKKAPKKIPFIKFSGAGNDFIVVDNRTRVMDPRKMSAFVTRVCTRHLSVGADGLIFIEKSPKAHFRWRLYHKAGGAARVSWNGGPRAPRFPPITGNTPQTMPDWGPASAPQAAAHWERVTGR